MPDWCVLWFVLYFFSWDSHKLWGVANWIIYTRNLPSSPLLFSSLYPSGLFPSSFSFISCGREKKPIHIIYRVTVYVYTCISGPTSGIAKEWFHGGIGTVALHVWSDAFFDQWVVVRPIQALLLTGSGELDCRPHFSTTHVASQHVISILLSRGLRPCRHGGGCRSQDSTTRQV